MVSALFASSANTKNAELIEERDIFNLVSSEEVLKLYKAMGIFFVFKETALLWQPTIHSCRMAVLTFLLV